MVLDLVAILVLVAVFVAGTFGPVNIGAVSLLACFVFGTVFLHEGPGDISSGFPANLFVLLFGITYLFSVATANGTTEYIVVSLARLVRGNAAVIPWLLFVVAGAATAAGAPGQAVAAIVAPLGMSLAAAFRIRLLLAGLMVIAGVCAGSFSPITTLGIIANQSVANAALTADPITLFLSAFAFNTVLAVGIYCMFGGLALLRTRSAETPGGDTPGSHPQPNEAGGVATKPRHRLEAVPLTTARALTLLAVVAVAVGALVFGLDIGYLAVCAAVVLHLLFPRADATARISWNVVLLICGLLTYIEMLDRAGTIDRVGTSIASIGPPLLAAVLLCGVAALVSAFASSTATIGAMIPLAVPLMADGGVTTIGLVTAICVSATVVDASPFSSAGALVVASTADEAQRPLYRGLLSWGLSMVIVAPILACLLFVLPRSLG